MSTYAELQVTSNYSFLRGASHPDELVLQAANLGYSAIAITDRNSLAGIVRAHVAAKEYRIKLIIGCRLDFKDYPSLLCYPTNRSAYGRLSQLLTLGKRRALKGSCHLFLDDIIKDGIFAKGKDQIIITIPSNRKYSESFIKHLSLLKHNINSRVYISVKKGYNGNDNRILKQLAQIAEKLSLPIVAVNDVHSHVSERRVLQDVLTCIRKKCTIYSAGYHLSCNAERYLKSPKEMTRLFSDFPDAIKNVQKIITKCQFNLDELGYDYPIDQTSQNRTTHEELEYQINLCMSERYPKGVPLKIKKQVKYELALIKKLNYAPYFLTVYDIVKFAKSRGILCQGRGSAANSAVCYVLGITSVDPENIEILFERFISTERKEPPDIDVDFENERREEVYQYIYEKYGRERAGITATHITYKAKSAFREVGKVMGLTEDTIQALSKSSWGSRQRTKPSKERIMEVGLDPKDETLNMVLGLSSQISGFPRYLSQHTGGFVITKNRLDSIVPIENASMDGRTVIEWDKNDLDALGILKIDILALGMLTCIRKTFEIIERHHSIKLTLANIPQKDQETYDMLCLGDSLGVFQVESRAQMNMLPRLKPRCFYDLVIQVAIVRPGPIQGNMVHPYLRRRSGEEEPEYPSADLEEVLKRTKGVPLFQEQAMQIAIVAAGFTPGEADGLRRAMATFRHNGNIQIYHDQLIRGMIKHGYEKEFAERCFKQIEGFGEYGFPESHAASFALLVYVSSWLKCHYPAAFAAALLNCQPMGFYKPAQIIRDAQEHGVEIQQVDINYSDWDNILEEKSTNLTKSKISNRNIKWRNFRDQSTSIRLGFCQIKGFKSEDANTLVSKRKNGYNSIPSMKDRTNLKQSTIKKLALSDSFQTLGLDRRQALWATENLKDPKSLPLFSFFSTEALQQEAKVKLKNMTKEEIVIADYKSLQLSLNAHPLSLLRAELKNKNIMPCKDLATVRDGNIIKVAGLILIRQRPSSAKGTMFITIEDETSNANIIIWPHKIEYYRQSLINSSLIIVEGKLQKEGIVTHIIADKIIDFSYSLAQLAKPKVTKSSNIKQKDLQSNITNKRLFPNPRDFH